jgi:hypothetical protein
LAKSGGRHDEHQASSIKSLFYRVGCKVVRATFQQQRQHAEARRTKVTMRRTEFPSTFDVVVNVSFALCCVCLFDWIN